MSFKFGTKSVKNMEKLHPSLKKVVHRALELSKVDFGVPDRAWRTLAEQQALVDAGKSQTLNSKHLIQPDGYSHAVDLVPFQNGYTWSNKGLFKYIIRAVFRAAIELGVQVECGMLWVSFEDCPHVQLR